VVVEFKNVPNNIYFARKNNLEPNLLVFRVQPMEGVYIKINAKRPSSEFSLLPISMDFCQNCGIGINTPEAYERLLYDAVRGDSTYFTRWDEVAEAWSFVDPIAEAWEEDAGDLAGYPAGTWGPQPDMLPAEDGFRWWPVNGQEEGEAVWVMI
jgi:glucose-6-phosphate 1-dehydrogenase